MDAPWYATREELRIALGSASTARDDAQLDRALDAGSRSVEDLCNRVFWPVVASRSWDWPNRQYARSWRLWLDDSDLISLTSLTAGGVAIPVEDVVLQPNRSGPPYTRIEISLASSSAFAAGDTPQKAIAVQGLFGFCDDATPAGTLTADVSSTSQTSITPSTPSAIGVGALVRVGDERMIVTGKTVGDTGQTLGADLPAKKDTVLVTVQDGTRFAKGDAITVGAETMLVRTVAGAQLTVDRAYDSTVLTAHTAGDTVRAPVELIVTRAAAGTTAATAVSGAAITRWVAPAQARTLAIAEAMCTLLNEQAGYVRTVRSQAGTGTRSVAAVTAERDELRAQVAASRLCRKVRTRAV